MDKEFKKRYGFSWVTIASLFFMWGFITCLNYLLVPYLQQVFDLSNFWSNFVAVSFFLAYFLVSLGYYFLSTLVGDPAKKIGYKNTIVLGLMLSAIGCFLFFLETSTEDPQFVYFLGAIFLLGAGFSFLQIASNPLILGMGPAETEFSRLNLTQVFNSLGTTLAPVIGGLVLFHLYNGGESTSTFRDPSAVQIPYLILTSALLILSGVVFFAEIPEPQDAQNPTMEIARQLPERRGALQYPYLIFGMIAIFCYVGAEVSIGTNLVGYMKGAYSFDNLTACFYLAYYWGGAMIGRFMGAISMYKDFSRGKKMLLMFVSAIVFFFVIYFSARIPLIQVAYFWGFIILNYIVFLLANSRPSRTTGYFAVVNIILLVFMLCSDNILSLWAVLSVGLFNSIMFSNIFTMAVDRLGKYTAQGSALLVMMIIGGAVVPPLQGWVADQTNAHIAFVVPLICYFYLVFYGFAGHKWGKKALNQK